MDDGDKHKTGTEVVLSKKEANKIAKLKFGDASFAIRVSSNDRNQRFGIMLVDSGSVFALGYGCSFVQALNMAEREVEQARLSVELDNKRKSEALNEVKQEVKE